MRTLELATSILRNNGINSYNSNLKKNSIVISEKKSLFSTKSQFKIVSNDYAIQVIYRHQLSKLFNLLKRYFQNNFSNKTALRFLSLILKVNKVFDEKLDDEKTNALLADIYKVISDNIVYEKTVFTNNKSNIKNYNIIKISPLNNNYKTIIYACNIKLNKILDRNQELDK